MQFIELQDDKKKKPKKITTPTIIKIPNDPPILYQPKYRPYDPDIYDGH